MSDLSLANCEKILQRMVEDYPVPLDMLTSEDVPALKFLQAYAQVHAAHSQRQIYEELAEIHDLLNGMLEIQRVDVR